MATKKSPSKKPAAIEAVAEKTPAKKAPATKTAAKKTAETKAPAPKKLQVAAEVPKAKPTHHDISVQAYLLWERDGKKHGHHDHYWQQAEKELHE